jgi:hypothetical protein
VFLALGRVIGVNDANPVHLIEPDRICRQQCAQDLSIFLNNVRVIPCTQAQIQGVIRRDPHAASPRGAEHLHTRPRGAWQNKLQV